MNASAFEFRLRYLTHAVIYVGAFAGPQIWSHYRHTPYQTVWLRAATWLSIHGWMSFYAAIVTLGTLAAVLALGGALLRTWGAAYLGADVVGDHAMHGKAIMADGPYRYMRNPLYVGTFLNSLAMAILLPPGGAIFIVLGIGIVQLRLMGGEEVFLSAKLGAPYLEYKARVPKIFPSLAPRIPAGGKKPRWIQAVLSEAYMWATLAVIAVVAWSFDAKPFPLYVLCAWGLSLVVRGAMPREAKAAV